MKLHQVHVLLSTLVKCWPLFQLDTKNAFLYCDPQKEVCKAQPQGYVAHGKSRKVCGFKKTIYGFKQSLRAWFDKFNIVVAKNGLKIITLDHSVFGRKQLSGTIILVMHVNDIVVTGDLKGISKLKGQLNRHFRTNNLGQL